jgi:pyridoxal phosphate enzyme (YggS family)
MSIASDLHQISSTIPSHVTLVAISKTHPVEIVMEAYGAGQRVFGENKVQEMVTKHEAMPKDIQWHLVGHLQTNKVRYIASFVSLIHSVDSLKLLGVIDKESQKAGRIIDCLLQVYIASEETKFGLSDGEVNDLLKSAEYQNYKNVRVVGLMGMASFTDNTTLVRQEFKTLTTLFNQLRDTYFKNSPEFKEISMGMSGDYQIAIEEGSTMVRIGSSIFGNRLYKQ